ncbi:hypothetical protein ACQ10K_16700, partial [Enterococcus faecium]
DNLGMMDGKNVISNRDFTATAFSRQVQKINEHTEMVRFMAGDEGRVEEANELPEKQTEKQPD